LGAFGEINNRSRLLLSPLTAADMAEETSTSVDA
jgi:hypothetical protein